MKIGLFADSHESDLAVSCRTRRPSLSYGKIKEAMTAFRAGGAELAICLGDLLDHCADRADDEREFIRLSEMIRSFGLPFYCVRGNHDCENFLEEDFYRIGKFQKPPFSETFGNKTLVFLDANYHDSGERYLPQKIDWTNSWLPPEQADRLKAVLADPAVEEAVVFLHELLNPSADPRYLVRNAAEIRAILEKSGKVRRVYCGHYHKGMRETCNGISYVALPAMCEGEENRYEIVEL